MNTFHLEIVSPEGIIYKDDIEEALLPTPKGEIGILPHHIPLFTKLSEGEVRVKRTGKDISFAISGGFLEIDKTTVRIISDYAVAAENIRVAHAEEAKRRAERLLSEKQKEKDFALIEKDLARSILELKIAEKVRKRHQQ